MFNNNSQSVLSLDRHDPMQWYCINRKSTNSHREEIENVQFWVDEVFQLVVGCIGIISNLFAILMLLNTKMIESMFNKLLTCLLILRSIYIASEMLIEIMYHSFHHDTEHITQTASSMYFYYLLQPVGKFMQYSTTFVTVLMAYQRYLASCYPVQYRNSTLTRNRTTDLIQYLLIVLLISALITIPKYLETSIEDNDIGYLHDLNATHFKCVGRTNRDQLYKNNGLFLNFHLLSGNPY